MHSIRQAIGLTLIFLTLVPLDRQLTTRGDSRDADFFGARTFLELHT